MFGAIAATAGNVFSNLTSQGIQSKFKIGSVLVMQAVGAACTVIMPFMLGAGFGTLANDAQEGRARVSREAIKYFGYFGLALVASEILPAASEIITAELKSEYSVTVNKKVIRKFPQLDLENFVFRPIGMYVQLIRQVFENQEAVPLILGQVFPSFLKLVGTSIFLSTQRWDIGLMLMSSQAMSLWITYRGSKPINELFSDQLRTGFMVFGRIIGRIEDYENIHLFGRVEDEFKNGAKELTNYGSKLQALIKAPEYSGIVQTAWNSLAAGGIVIYSLDRLNAGQLSFNSFAMILVYILQQFNSVTRLHKSANQLVICEAGMKISDDFLNQVPKIRSPEHPLQFRIMQSPRVTFDKVTFRYKDEVILDGVSFELMPGSKTALVGLSGAGKSTIGMLLSRFYDPNSGTIAVNEIDIKAVPLEDLRSLLGVVQQQPRLPNSSPMEVMQYANAKADEKTIRSMLEKVKMHGFLDQRDAKDKKATVGEGGKGMSGGQKQRIAIARALLKNPLICILDEVTSALDMETANDIQHMLDVETAGRTTLVISHQLLSVTNADKIIVLDNGRIIQQGTFDELKKDNSGRFYKLLEQFCKSNSLDINSIVATKRPLTKALAHREDDKMDYVVAYDSAGGSASAPAAPSGDSRRPLLDSSGGNAINDGDSAAPAAIKFT